MGQGAFDYGLVPQLFLKPKGFCPNPLVRYGIPAFADSKANPKVIGTPAWREFWEEQIHYCLNGYTTAGIHIPARYYHFLNNCKISSVDSGRPHNPDYVDFQYELSLLVEHAKRPDVRKNLLIPKGGRKGLSEMGASTVDYGYRFLDGYHAGIAAGAKENSDDFLAKWKSMDSLMVNELKVRKLSKNWDDIVAGWEEKSSIGGTNTFGVNNTIHSRTMFSNPNVFEGKYLTEVIFEEAGLFDKLLETFDSAVECMKRGNLQYGTFYIYGRGGNIKTGSKGFEYMWHHYEDYNCIRFPVLGKQYYLPCVAGTKDDNGKLIEDIPNLLQYTEEERVGMEDTVRAEELIKATNAKLKASGNIEKWMKHTRDNPIEIKEFFRRANSNNFAFEALNDQAYAVQSDPDGRRWDKYVLSWKKDAKGIKVFPLEVICTPATEETPDEDCVMITKDGMPVPGTKNLHTGGLDSYDQDIAMASRSLGAMCVRRRNHNIHGMRKCVPVCIIRTRPARKEMFYERCLMVSVFYGLYRTTLIDAAKPAIIKFYQDNAGEQYLALRPKKYESPNSEQSHKYGMLVPVPSVVHSLMQTDIFDNCHNFDFEMLIDELLSYDEAARWSESDKDLADAYGFALAMDGAMEYGVRDETEEEDIDKAMEMPKSYMDSEGNMRMEVGRGGDEYSLDNVSYS